MCWAELNIIEFLMSFKVNNWQALDAQLGDTENKIFRAKADVKQGREELSVELNKAKQKQEWQRNKTNTRIELSRNDGIQIGLASY